MSPVVDTSYRQPQEDGLAPPPETKAVYKIASIPADGIGPEVIEAGIEVLKAIAKKGGKFRFEFEDFDWSSERYKKTGRYLPDNHLDILRAFDAILYVRSRFIKSCTEAVIGTSGLHPCAVCGQAS